MYSAFHRQNLLPGITLGARGTPALLRPEGPKFEGKGRERRGGSWIGTWTGGSEPLLPARESGSVVSSPAEFGADLQRICVSESWVGLGRVVGSLTFGSYRLTVRLQPWAFIIRLS